MQTYVCTCEHVCTVSAIIKSQCTVCKPVTCLRTDSHNFNGLVLKILKGKYERPRGDYSSASADMCVRNIAF